jgi:hypothetical protein
MSVGELVPEVHRTSRGQVDQSTEAMELGEVEAENKIPTGDSTAEHRRVKTTLEDWENEQVPERHMKLLVEFVDLFSFCFMIMFNFVLFENDCTVISSS